MNKVAKSSRSRSDTAVQGTNDHSIVSKSSMARLKYASDEYLKYFVRKTVRRAPLINRGYYIRFLAMDACYYHFIKSYESCKKQILVMGAGFDSSYFRLKSLGLLEDTLYIEVDFPELVMRKTALIQQTPELNSVLQDLISSPCDSLPESTVIGINSEGFKLIGADLTRHEALNSVLRQAGWNPQLPTLCVSEVVLAYMTPTSSSSVIKWAADVLSNAMFAVFEQIEPSDAFGLIMQSHFRKIGSPLKGLNTFPSIMSQIERFQNLGWEVVEASDLSSLGLISEEEICRIREIEPFDEYEEWHSYCNHYLLLTAFKGSCCALAGNIVPKSCSNSQDSKVSQQNGKTSSYMVSSHPEVTLDSDNADQQVNTSDSQTGPALDECCGASPPCDQYKRITSGSNVHNPCYKSASCQADCDNTSHYCDISSICDRNPSTTLTTEVAPCNWTLLTDNASAFHMFGHSCVDIGDALIVCTGGFGEKNDVHLRQSEILLYDRVSGAYHRECVEPVGVLCRQFHTMTLLGNGDILVYGGRSSPTKPSSDTVLIRIPNRSAHHQSERPVLDAMKPEVEVISCHSDVPSSRWRHSATKVVYSGTEHVCIFGGCNVTDRALSDAFMFNTTDYVWKKLDSVGEVPCARHSHTADVVGDTMYIAAGLGADEVPLNSIYTYSLCEARWSKLDLHGHFRSRYSHTSAVIDDQLLLLGGCTNQNPPPGLAVIQLETGVVQEFSLPHQDPEHPVLLHNHVTMVTKENQLLSVGGGGNCFSFGTHFNSVLVLVDVPET